MVGPSLTTMTAHPSVGSPPAAPLALTGEELAAVASALAAQGTRMSKAALSAARKVVAAEPQAVERIAENLSNVVQLRPRLTAAPRVEVDEDIRDLLEQAVADRRVVRILYSDGRSRPSDREVEPAGVVAAGGRWYLLGWCRAKQEGRGFRMDRVLAVKITGEPVPDRALADILGPLAQPLD